MDLILNNSLRESYILQLSLFAWEQRKFGDLADYKKGPFGSAITKDTFVPKSEESIKVYEQQNAINKDWELERYFLPKEYALTKLKSFEVHGGDIIVSCAGTIGKIYEIPKNADTGVINQALMRVRVDEDCVDKRMFKIAFSTMIDDFTRAHSNGSAIKNIPPFSDLKPMGVLLPSLQEQEKISSYFENLDNLITLHQRKYNKLLNVKKSMLEKMFPKNGSNIPEIRFKGFTDPWEQRKLIEFVDKAVDNRGKTPPLDENGTHPLIEVASLGGVHPNYSKIEKYLNDDTFENNLRAYIKKGDILFTTVGSIGIVSLMDSREEAAIAQNIVAFRAKENFAPEYLYALFSNEENQYKAKRIVMGAVQPSIKVSQLVDVEYMLTTNEEEQKKIGSYFRHLDNLITLHQRELEKLQNIKKSMLEKMFV